MARLLSINTLKSIRKWRDRAFMLGERVRDWLQLPAGKRILFSTWPEVEDSVRRGFWGMRHKVTFGPVPAGGGDFDLVVPTMISALGVAAADSELRRRNPLPIPDPELLDLLDDKAALNARLVSAGFSRHVPKPAVPGSFPLVLKRRRDSRGVNSFVIRGPRDEDAHRECLGSADYLLQECIEGETEYSAHVLMIGGRLRRALTVEFRMGSDRAIHGRDPVLLMRRCRNRHTGIFEGILRSLGFEGLCCIDNKERGRIPYVLEINPRFGYSLKPFFAAFVRSLDWDRAAGK